MSRSILVPVSNAVDDVFAVLPFDECFEPVFKAIEAAALKADLVARRVDRTPKNQDFVKDIVRRTREDKIIVAVISPEADSKTANPNVMYELGMAHALGKATILLTTDCSQLPADLRTKQVIEYNPEQLDDRFIFQLFDQMKLVKARIKNGITDSAEQDIGVVEGFPTSWRELMKVLSFAKQYHRSFQELDIGHLDALQHEGNEIINGNPSQERLSWLKYSFQNNWNRYLDQVDTAKVNLGLNQFRPDVIGQAFDIILKSSADRNLINRCIEFTAQIRNQYEVYSRFHDEARTLAHHSVIALFDKPNASEMLTKLMQLSGDAKRLVMLSDSLILNMINLITEVGESI